MAYSRDQIWTAFRRFVNRHGGNWADVQVGITNYPERRLDEHGLFEDEDCIWALANSADCARDIEDEALRKGAQGGGGGGNENSVYIYLFMA